MSVCQTTKDEKSSLKNHLSYRDNTLQRWDDKVYSHLLNFYHFLINRLAFKFKKLSESKLLEKESTLTPFTGNSDSADIIRIEICSAKMHELLAKHQICAADIRCLDTKSKRCLRKLCLKTCLYSTSSTNLAHRHLDNLKSPKAQNHP